MRACVMCDFPCTLHLCCSHSTGCKSLPAGHVFMQGAGAQITRGLFDWEARNIWRGLTGGWSHGCVCCRQGGLCTRRLNSFYYCIRVFLGCWVRGVVGIRYANNSS